MCAVRVAPARGNPKFSSHRWSGRFPNFAAGCSSRRSVVGWRVRFHPRGNTRCRLKQDQDSQNAFRRLAGILVVLKWKLLTETGGPVTNLRSASLAMVSGVSCTATDPTSAAGVSVSAGPLINLGNGNHTFRWKTPKSATGCVVARLSLEREGPIRHDAFLRVQIERGRQCAAWKPPGLLAAKWLLSTRSMNGSVQRHHDFPAAGSTRPVGHDA